MKQRIDRLTQWFIQKAEGKSAPWWIAAFAFLDALILPTPADPVLAAVVYVRPRSWLFFTIVATVGSVIGGIAGYALGYIAFDTLGTWLLSIAGEGISIDPIRASLASGVFAATLLAALGPLPFTLFVVAAGFLALPFVPFLIAAIIGRFARFAIVAFIAGNAPKWARDLVQKILSTPATLIATILVLILIVYWVYVR